MKEEKIQVQYCRGFETDRVEKSTTEPMILESFDYIDSTQVYLAAALMGVGMVTIAMMVGCFQNDNARIVVQSGLSNAAIVVAETARNLTPMLLSDSSSPASSHYSSMNDLTALHSDTSFDCSVCWQQI